MYYKLEFSKYLGVSGDFSFKIIRPDGTVKKNLPEGKNLILDQGLDYLNSTTSGINAMFHSCVLGVGTTEPQITDIALNTPVGSASTSKVNYTPSWSEVSSNILRMRRQFRFDFNTAGSTGISDVQLAEVGIRASGTLDLISRSLIKDAQGNPTTIQLLPEEVLQVTYGFNFYFDVTPIEGTFVLNVGEDEEEIYSYQANFSNLGSTSSTTDYAWSQSYNATRVRAFTQRDLSPPTSSGPSTGGELGTLTRRAYVPGTYKRTHSAQFSIAQGNVGGIGYMNFQAPSQTNLFQVRIGRQSDDAPIPKTNEYRLEFDSFFHMSINRYEGPDEASLPPIDTPEEP